jgi:hypothetical protein
MNFDYDLASSVAIPFMGDLHVTERERKKKEKKSDTLSIKVHKGGCGVGKTKLDVQLKPIAIRLGPLVVIKS